VESDVAAPVVQGPEGGQVDYRRPLKPCPDLEARAPAAAPPAPAGGLDARRRAAGEREED
jgi:hypothetical protein